MYNYNSNKNCLKLLILKFMHGYINYLYIFFFTFRLLCFYFYIVYVIITSLFNECLSLINSQIVSNFTVTSMQTKIDNSYMFFCRLVNFLSNGILKTKQLWAADHT